MERLIRIILAGASMRLTIFCPECKHGSRVQVGQWQTCSCGTQHLVMP